MKGRQLIAFARVLVLALPLSCQDDKGGGTPTPPPASKLAGKSFDAEEFACTPKKSSSKQNDKSANSKAKSKGDGEEKSRLALLADEAAAPVWTGDIQNLLKDNCLPCHAANATPPDLSSYAGASASATDNLERMQRTGAGIMPPAAALPAADVERFSAWLQGGKLESAPSGGSDGGSEETEDPSDPADDEEDPTEDPDEDSESDESESDDDSGKKSQKAAKKPLCPNIKSQGTSADPS